MACTAASSTPHANDPISGTGITQPAYIVSCGSFVAGAGSCTLNAAQTVSVAEIVTIQVALFAPKWYDNSGNIHDVSQGTTANQPQLLLNCGNALPCVRFDTSSSWFLAGTIPSTSQPMSLSSVAKRTGNTSAYNDLIGTSSAGTIGASIEFSNSSNLAGISSNVAEITRAASELSFHSVSGTYNGASSSINVDGSATTGNPGTSGANTSIGIGYSNYSGFPNYLTGFMVEGIVYPFGLTGAQQNGLCHNQTYWGAFGC